MRSSYMKIAYIGPKSVKVDKTSGSRMVFRRFEPLEVEKEYGLRLLRFPTVFVEEKDLEAVQLEIISKKEAAAEAAAQKVKLIKQEAVDASRVVLVGGDEVDLRKYTQIKLETLVAAEDLELSPKGSSERVQEYCDRVFTAFVEKQAAKASEESEGE